MAASSPAVLIPGPRSEERHGDRIRGWARPPAWSLRSQSQRVARIFLDDIFPLDIFFCFGFSSATTGDGDVAGSYEPERYVPRCSSRYVDTAGWWARLGRDLRWLLWVVRGVWDRSSRSERAIMQHGEEQPLVPGTKAARICCFAREMSPRERAANEWLRGVTRRTHPLGLRMTWGLTWLMFFTLFHCFSDSVISTVKKTSTNK